VAAQLALLARKTAAQTLDPALLVIRKSVGHHRRAALLRRVCKGHATPGWVLHSNSGCCIGTIKKSRTYEISSTIERFRALSVNFLKIKGRQKSQQLKKKSLASLS